MSEKVTAAKPCCSAGNDCSRMKRVFRERSRKIDKEKLIKAVEQKPDAYLYELAQLFSCSPQAIFLMLDRLNITRKKRLGIF